MPPAQTLRVPTALSGVPPPVPEEHSGPCRVRGLRLGVQEACSGSPPWALAITPVGERSGRGLLCLLPGLLRPFCLMGRAGLPARCFPLQLQAGLTLVSPCTTPLCACSPSALRVGCSLLSQKPSDPGEPRPLLGVKPFLRGVAGPGMMRCCDQTHTSLCGRKGPGLWIPL